MLNLGLSNVCCEQRVLVIPYSLVPMLHMDGDLGESICASGKGSYQSHGGLPTNHMNFHIRVFTYPILYYSGQTSHLTVSKEFEKEGDWFQLQAQGHKTHMTWLTLGAHN